VWRKASEELQTQLYTNNAKNNNKKNKNKKKKPGRTTRTRTKIRTKEKQEQKETEYTTVTRRFCSIYPRPEKFMLFYLVTDT